MTVVFLRCPADVGFDDLMKSRNQIIRRRAFRHKVLLKDVASPRQILNIPNDVICQQCGGHRSSSCHLDLGILPGYMRLLWQTEKLEGLFFSRLPCLWRGHDRKGDRKTSTNSERGADILMM